MSSSAAPSLPRPVSADELSFSTECVMWLARISQVVGRMNDHNKQQHLTQVSVVLLWSQAATWSLFKIICTVLLFQCVFLLFTFFTSDTLNLLGMFVIPLEQQCCYTCPVTVNRKTSASLTPGFHRTVRSLISHWLRIPQLSANFELESMMSFAILRHHHTLFEI